MSKKEIDAARRLMSLMFKAHPWHGVSMGDQSPDLVTAYIEIVPSDTVKYEVDKATGFLKVGRPQRFSNFCPVYYGLIPQTYCGERVAKLFGARAGRPDMIGDGDPLDICVLTEKAIPHSDILLTARPIGGFSMADGGEADDKIIAVMRDYAVYGTLTDLKECPMTLLDRLQHYFLTYKQAPGSTQHERWRLRACSEDRFILRRILCMVFSRYRRTSATSRSILLRVAHAKNSFLFYRILFLMSIVRILLRHV